MKNNMIPSAGTTAIGSAWTSLRQAVNKVRCVRSFALVGSLFCTAAQGSVDVTFDSLAPSTYPCCGAGFADGSIPFAVSKGSYGARALAEIRAVAGTLPAPPPLFRGNFARCNRALLNVNMTDVRVAMGESDCFLIKLDYQVMAHGVKLQINGMPIAKPNFVAMGGAIVGGALITADSNSLQIDGRETGTPITQFSIAGRDLRLDNVSFFPRLLGSWEQTIKDENEWDRDDIRSTVDALLETGQDFIIYNADAQSAWEDLEKLLIEASGTRLKVFAQVAAPHVIAADSRWFDMDGDGDRGTVGDTPRKPWDACAGFTDAEEKWSCVDAEMEYWLDAWRAAAGELCSLSLDYPHLAGFVINDFMGYIESADLSHGYDARYLTKDDIRTIHNAAHCAPRSKLGFYPALPTTDVRRFVSPGYILGVNYGARLQPGESMSVLFDVTLPADPDSASLTFYQSNTANITNTGVQRSVWANSTTTPVWSAPWYVASEPRIEFAEHKIDLHTGTNTIELKLDGAGTPTNGCSSSTGFWYVWDVTLDYWMWSGGRLVKHRCPLEPRFETVADTTRTYAPTVNCTGVWFTSGNSNHNGQCRLNPSACSSASDSSSTGYEAKRLVAASNQNYLIQDVVDGIVPYWANTDVLGAKDALDPSGHYRQLLESTKRHLGSDLLIPIHTAFDVVADVDPDVLVDRLKVAAKTSDATGVYLYPLGLHFMDPADRRGIFAETDPALVPVTRSTISGELPQFVAQWPGRQWMLPGWYVRWVHQPPSGTTVNMSVEVWDSRDMISAMSRLFKGVSGGGGDPFLVGLYTDGTDAITVPTDSTLLSSHSGDPVTISLSATAGAAVNCKAYFRVVDESGVGIPEDDWRFESGVDDPTTVEIYEKVRDLFRSIR